MLTNRLTTKQYAAELAAQYEKHRVDAFTTRHFGPEILHAELDAIVAGSSGILKSADVGNSFEGRPIRRIMSGSGSTAILLWSQMHGDEPTATMAIVDILQYLSRTRREESTRRVLSALTLHFLPMLNPDGAARVQRRTAQGIDMNRDALALVTPEARLLKQVQHDVKPAFGFNLHDQELSTVGTSKELTTIALLAPASSPQKYSDPVIVRAKQAAAQITELMDQFIPNSITRYDDTFEPRAFGENMQSWGTSTVLVESGHTMDDPEKHFIRKLNFIGMLGALYSIATGEYLNSDISRYEKLPFNSKRAFDLIIRNVLIDHGEGSSTLADLAVSYQIDTHTGQAPILVDVGDLQPFIGLKEVDGKRKKIPQQHLSPGKEFPWQKFF